MVKDRNIQQSRVHRRRISSLISHAKERQGSKTIIIEDRFAERLTDRLREASLTVQQSHTPHLLFRTIIEEHEDALQEEVGVISGRYFVIMIYTFGGFIASGFQKIEVYTLDKFTKWIMQKGKKISFYNALKVE